MNITASMVKELRDKTNAGMMNCKEALASSGGDFEKAVEYLRKKGLSAATKRSSRAAKGLPSRSTASSRDWLQNRCSSSSRCSRWWFSSERRASSTPPKSSSSACTWSTCRLRIGFIAILPRVLSRVRGESVQTPSACPCPSACVPGIETRIRARHSSCRTESAFRRTHRTG